MTNVVKQSWVLVPTLFSIILSVMLTDVLRETTLGIPIRYRCDGKILISNVCKLSPKSKDIVIRNLIFADDFALNATE